MIRTLKFSLSRDHVASQTIGYTPPSNERR